MQKAYKAILFDLGGVLIDIDYHATERAFEQLGVVDFKERYTQLSQNELFDRFECGEISPQHFVNLLLPFAQSGTSPNQVVSAWNAMLGSFPLEKIKLLERLSKTTPLYMLSNTNELHWIEVKRAWQKVTTQPMQHFFSAIYLSHEIGKRKPHPETFVWVCQQMGFEPADVLFLDDSPQHIEGATQAGLQVHYYQDAAAFYALFS
jgi:putative hydrolase of the HAD superfamily